MTRRLEQSEVPQQRGQFVDGYIKPVTRNPFIIDAFEQVPREFFAPPQHAWRIHQDEVIPLKGVHSTMSQPSMMARMLDYVGVDGRGKALEVGTASGYGAALLSLCTEYTYSIELDEQLAHAARKRLGEGGYENVSVYSGDGSLGIPDAAPFDIIIVTAASLRIPLGLKDQLGENGRIVIPLEFEEGGEVKQSLVVGIKKNGILYTERVLEDIGFVPLLDGGTAEALRLLGEEQGGNSFDGYSAQDDMDLVYEREPVSLEDQLGHIEHTKGLIRALSDGMVADEAIEAFLLQFEYPQKQ